MARVFAKSFYDSKVWKDIRDYIYNRDDKVCVECGKPGEEVHHKIWLNPENINDPYITLGENNLILLCKKCHMNIHRPKEKVTRANLMFDEEGNLIEA